MAAKPWGDSESYDYIVNARRSFNFWRVQVKSAHVAGEDGTYSFRAHDHAQRSYSAKDIDALVAYARPIGAWYVFPVRVVERLKGLKLYPRAGRSGRSMRSIATVSYTHLDKGEVDSSSLSRPTRNVATSSWLNLKTGLARS